MPPVAFYTVEPPVAATMSYLREYHNSRGAGEPGINPRAPATFVGWGMSICNTASSSRGTAGDGGRSGHAHDVRPVKQVWAIVAFTENVGNTNPFW
ncbi:MAG TPA: hypothetical protein VMB71_04915 [Acetobacteraceae bacterium]|nr:hypothetical protein [Acetobacteraceae bacterium]